MGQGRGGLDPATSGALRNPSGVLGGTGYRTKDWIERLRGSHRRGGQMLGKQRLSPGGLRSRDNRGSEELRSVGCWGREASSLGRRRAGSPCSRDSEAQWLGAGVAGAGSRNSEDSEEWWMEN